MPINEAARRLHVGRKTIRGWIADGVLCVHGTGGRPGGGGRPAKFVSQQELRRLVADRESVRAALLPPRGSPACDNVGRSVPFGRCHGGCGNPAGIAPQTDNRRGWILGYLKLYCDDPECWRPAALARAHAARRQQVAQLQEALKREKACTGELEVDEVSDGSTVARSRLLPSQGATGSAASSARWGNGGAYLFTETDVEKLQQLAPGRAGRPSFRFANGEMSLKQAAVSLKQAAEFLGVSTQLVAASTCRIGSSFRFDARVWVTALSSFSRRGMSSGSLSLG